MINRYQLQCSVLDSFYTETQGPVFLSVGPDAKLDMLKTFDLDQLFDLYLDPPSTENPPLCTITQDGKDPIITMDFYLTNMKPREWILPTPLANYETTTSTVAAEASNLKPEIPPDPVQLGEIRLHSWMLYTPQAALSHSRSQANSTVERGPRHKVRVKKLPKKGTDKSTQTEKQKK